MENSFEEIWARIKSETGLKSLQGLANVVNISQPAVSEMKAKGKFPPGWAYLVGKKYGLLTEWIMTGKGPKTLEEASKTRKFELLSEIEQWIAELIAREPSRAEWFEHQFLDSFSNFREWREEKKKGDKMAKGIPTNRKVA